MQLMHILNAQPQHETPPCVREAPVVHVWSKVLRTARVHAGHERNGERAGQGEGHGDVRGGGEGLGTKEVRVEGGQGGEIFG